MPALFFFGPRALRMDPAQHASESSSTPFAGAGGPATSSPFIRGTNDDATIDEPSAFPGIHRGGQPEHAGDRGGARSSRRDLARPVVVASGNGLRAVEKAMELVKQGHDPLDAAIEGVAIVEADPEDHSVGLGGLPNEDGVVELDAAVMHGPTHGGGSVASIRNIMHPAAVARLVMKRTRHCLLVGEGALRFARAHGFPEVNLLTDEARQIWLHWKETHDPNDDWVPPPDEAVAVVRPRVHQEASHRHDPLLGARHPRRPRLHDDDLGPVVEDPRPGRRFADPGRRAVPRQRGRLGRLDGRRRGQPAEPLQPPGRRGDAARASVPRTR